MKTPQRVVWTEGLFMTPQHLQQLDRYHEGLLAARLAAVAPYDWGVLGLEIDARSLATGTLRLTRFTGIFPDGLALDFDERHAEAPPTRALEGHFPPTQPRLDVYLAVVNERDGAANVAPDRAAGTRFVQVVRNVTDGVLGTNEVAVAFAQRNVQLLFGDEPRENVSVVKIAEMVRDAAGAFALREAFVPACRTVAASPFLMAGMRKILATVSARQRALSESRRQRDASSVEFTANDVTRFLRLDAFNGFLPVLAHLTEAAGTSPEQAYLALVQFAGRLCTFAPNEDPSQMPPFVYTDLGATFEALFTRINALLTFGERDNTLAVKLETNETGLQFGRLDDERLVRSPTYILAVKSDLPEAQVVEQLPKLSKIASWQDINAVVQSATPGVPLQVTYRPPPEIPIRSGVVYFELRIGDRYWRNVLQERAVAIYLPPPFDVSRARIELLAVPPGDR